MKNPVAVLALVALLAFSFCTLGAAQAPAPAPSGNAAVAAPLDVADFLATLSDGQAAAPGVDGLTPSPTFRSTLCNTNADCPTGQLCCYPCGIDDCHNVCMTPVRKRCPLFV